MLIPTCVTEPQCRPAHEKSSNVSFQVAQNNPLPYENRPNIGGIEKNSEYVKKEEDAH